MKKKFTISKNYDFTELDKLIDSISMPDYIYLNDDNINKLNKITCKTNNNFKFIL